MIDFGDVFRFKDELYVYLIQAGELVFAARILDIETTKQLKNFREKNSKNPNKRVGDQPMYCFVILTTDDFKDHAAHYGNPQIGSLSSIESIKRLCDKDVEQLKKEIMEDQATNILLRDSIKKLYSKTK